MIVRMNVALRNLLVEAWVNSGASISFFDGATVEFRTGAQPATADLGASGTVICTLVLPADAMAAVVSGTSNKNAAAWEDTSADASGTIGHVRFKSAGGATYVLDCDVTDQAGTGAVKVDNPVLVTGQDFLVTDFSITMPASS